MNFAFDGIRDTTITMPAGTGAAAGQPAVLNADGEVVTAATGQTIIGLITAVRDGVASVQVGGVACFPYTSTAPVPGFAQLAANGKGGVLVSSSAGRSMLVLSADTTRKRVWCLL